MKLLVLSDIHANSPALQQIEPFAQQADRIVCLGDIVGYNAFPNECIAWLKDHNAQCVKGNHDQATLDDQTEWFHDEAAQAIEWTRKVLTNESRQFLQELPLEIHLEEEGITLLAVHGSPRDPLHEYIFPDDPVDVPEGIDILALGHTHIPFIRQQKITQTHKTKNARNQTVFNPGSVGQPRDDDSRLSCAMLEMSNGKTYVQIKRLQYPIGQTAAANRKAGLPERFSQRLFKGF